MHLTSISQCKVNQVVYHPVHGKGVIKAINESHPDQALYHFCVFVDFGAVKKWFWSDNIEDSTMHLYTEPIQVVTKDQFDTMAGIIEYFASRYDENYMDDQIGRDMISMAQQLLIEIKPE